MFIGKGEKSVGSEWKTDIVFIVDVVLNITFYFQQLVANK